MDLKRSWAVAICVILMAIACSISMFTVPATMVFIIVGIILNKLGLKRYVSYIAIAMSSWWCATPSSSMPPWQRSFPLRCSRASLNRRCRQQRWGSRSRCARSWDKEVLLEGKLHFVWASRSSFSYEGRP